MRILISLLLLLSSHLTLADYPLELIELQSRQADEMIPMLRPFIDKDGSIAGMGRQLIIRTSERNFQEIQKILQRFDQPAQNLMIYVRQTDARNARQNRQAININSPIGNQSKLIVGRARPDNTIEYRVKSARTRSHLDATHRVRTLEGRAAFITTGQSIPVRQQNTTIVGGVVHQQTTTRYRNATSGFYVLPRLNGNHVTLEISSHMNRPGSIQGNYDIQQASTVLSGELGEWITLGGISDTINNNQRGILRNVETYNSKEGFIQLLVEKIR